MIKGTLYREQVKMTKCNKCGKEYKTYPIFINNSPLVISRILRMKEDYPNLCESCFNWECEKVFTNLEMLSLRRSKK